MSARNPANVSTRGTAPEFSIILATFNRAHLLPRAIASVCAQTHPDFELIIVDDASTDGTRELVAALADPSVVYVRSEHNGGAAASRNLGLDHARGEYVSFLDDDDELLPEFLAEMHRAFSELPSEVGFSWCGVQKVVDTNGGEEPFRTQTWPAQNLGSAAPHDLAHLAIGTGYGLTVRRSCFAATGTFDESLRAGVDLDLLVRLGECFGCRPVSKVLVKVHLHPGPQLTDATAEKASSFLRILAKHREYFERHGEASHPIYRKAIALCYRVGLRAEGRRLILRMLRERPGRWRTWKSFFLLEIFGTEALGLRVLVGKPFSWRRPIV